MRHTRTIVVEEVVDDLTGEVLDVHDVKTIRFGWAEQWFEIDLATVVAETFEHLIAPYVAHARPLDLLGPTSSERKKRRNYREEQERKEFLKGLRQWAHDSDLAVPPSGVVPRDIEERYRLFLSQQEAAVESARTRWHQDLS